MKSITRVAVSSLRAALEVSGVKQAAKTVLSCRDAMSLTGKLMGVALIRLQEQFRTRIKKGGTYFSQFLKQEGIARSTAFYAMNAAKGKGRKVGKSKKQPSIPQLLKRRDNLQLKLSKATKKEERQELKSDLERVKVSLLRKQDVLKNRIKTLSTQLEQVIKGIAAFGESPEAKTVGGQMLGALKEFGLIQHKLNRNAAPVYTFQSNGTVDVSVPKKPVSRVLADVVNQHVSHSAQA